MFSKRTCCSRLRSVTLLFAAFVLGGCATFKPAPGAKASEHRARAAVQVLPPKLIKAKLYESIPIVRSYEQLAGKGANPVDRLKNNPKEGKCPLCQF